MASWIISILKFFGSSLLDRLIKLGKELYFKIITERQLEKEKMEGNNEQESAKKAETFEEKIAASEEFLNKRGRP